jgi:uncharacterized RDD family membrane protein YckC
MSMQIHVQKDFGTYGPYSLEELQDLIRKGRFKYEDLAWVDGTPEWAPISQIPGIYSRPAPILHEDLVEDGAQVRPWVRFWARSVDGILIAILVSVPLEFLMPAEMNSRVGDRIYSATAMLVWIPIEAVLLSFFGTTPGKALLRVKVSNKDGSNLSFPQALRRSVGVWLRGQAIGIFPLATIVANFMSYRTLRDTGVTSWDRYGRFLVTHRTVGMLRAFAVILIFALFLVLVYVGIKTRIEEAGN